STPSANFIVPAAAAFGLWFFARQPLTQTSLPTLSRNTRRSVPFLRNVTGEYAWNDQLSTLPLASFTSTKKYGWGFCQSILVSVPVNSRQFRLSHSAANEWWADEGKADSRQPTTAAVATMRLEILIDGLPSLETDDYTRSVQGTRQWRSQPIPKDTTTDGA